MRTIRGHDADLSASGFERNQLPAENPFGKGFRQLIDATKKVPGRGVSGKRVHRRRRDGTRPYGGILFWTGAVHWAK